MLKMNRVKKSPIFYGAMESWGIQMFDAFDWLILLVSSYVDVQNDVSPNWTIEILHQVLIDCSLLVQE